MLRTTRASSDIRLGSQGGVPDHTDIDLSHFRHGRNCVLHHHRQFLRRRAIGRGQLANDGHDTRALRAYISHKNIQHTVRYAELSEGFWRD